MDEMARGLAFPEGPVALADGAVLVGEEGRGVITRVEPDGFTSPVADTGGAPNGLAMGPDGLLYVCNNGGLSFSNDGVWTPLGLAEGHTGGSIQRVHMDTGEVETVFIECEGTRLGAPNDLVFDRNGLCWFTDILRGAVIVADIATGRLRTQLAGLELPNGIGFSPDGDRLFVSETYSGNLLVASPDGREPTVMWSSRGTHGLDSLAVDGNGNICVASLGTASGITVVSPDGATRDVVRTPEPDEFVTNICFGGDPGSPVAYITSSGLGRLYAMPWPLAN